VNGLKSLSETIRGRNPERFLAKQLKNKHLLKIRRWLLVGGQSRLNEAAKSFLLANHLPDLH
jgi:hypothetical protein